MRNRSARIVQTGLLAAGLAFLVSGCTGSNVSNDWHCPLPEGSRCEPIGSIDPWGNVHKSNVGTEHSAEHDPAPVEAQEPGFLDKVSGYLSETFDDVHSYWNRHIAPDAAKTETPSGQQSVASSVPTVETAPLGEVQKVDTAPKVYRRPELTARIWIAPYTDVAGSFHEGEFIHTVVRPATWEGE